SATTSLLVLETLEQLVKHDIVPPITLKTVYDEFMKQRKELQSATQKPKGDHLRTVCQWWTARLAWFEEWRTKPAPTEEDDHKYAAAQKKTHHHALDEISICSTGATVASLSGSEVRYRSAPRAMMAA